MTVGLNTNVPVQKAPEKESRGSSSLKAAAIGGVGMTALLAGDLYCPNVTNKITKWACFDFSKDVNPAKSFSKNLGIGSKVAIVAGVAAISGLIGAIFPGEKSE